MRNTAWRIIIATLVLVALTGANDAGEGVITSWVDWVRGSTVGKFAAALALSTMTWAINWMRAAARISDRGGTIQVALLGLLGGVLTSIASGSPLDPKLFETVFAVALTSIGGYTAIKRIAWPKDVGAPVRPVDVVSGTIDIPPADAPNPLEFSGGDATPTDPQKKRPGTES